MPEAEEGRGARRNVDGELQASDEPSESEIGFAALVNIFNPEKIVLGGPVSVAGEYLMPSIRESVRKHAMQEIVSQTEINLSAFGPDASLIGAAAVVVDDVLTYPSHVEKEVMPRPSPAEIVEYR